jgi:hypothetical protein
MDKALIPRGPCARVLVRRVFVLFCCVPPPDASERTTASINEPSFIQTIGSCSPLLPVFHPAHEQRIISCQASVHAFRTDKGEGCEGKIRQGSWKKRQERHGPQNERNSAFRQGRKGRQGDKPEASRCHRPLRSSEEGRQGSQEKIVARSVIAAVCTASRWVAQRPSPGRSSATNSTTPIDSWSPIRAVGAPLFVSQKGARPDIVLALSHSVVCCLQTSSHAISPDRKVLIPGGNDPNIFDHQDHRALQRASAM